MYVNLPQSARQPVPHMGQVDASGMVSHNINYNTKNTTILVIFVMGMFKSDII